MGPQGMVAGWGHRARKMGLCGYPKMHPGRMAEYSGLWGNALRSSGTWHGQQKGGVASIQGLGEAVAEKHKSSSCSTPPALMPITPRGLGTPF